MVCTATSAFAQTTSHEAIAIGVVAAPAFDGFTDFWFMPAVRISVPFGSRVTIDLDAGRVLGGTREHPATSSGPASTLRPGAFYTGQLRLLTAPRRADGDSTYWMIGLHHVTTRRLDRGGNLMSREPGGGGLLGFGADQMFANGTRLAAEVGISGPDGFRPFLAVAVQWAVRFR